MYEFYSVELLNKNIKGLGFAFKAYSGNRINYMWCLRLMFNWRYSYAVSSLSIRCFKRIWSFVASDRFFFATNISIASSHYHDNNTSEKSQENMKNWFAIPFSDFINGLFPLSDDFHWNFRAGATSFSDNIYTPCAFFTMQQLHRVLQLFYDGKLSNDYLHNKPYTNVNKEFRGHSFARSFDASKLVNQLLPADLSSSQYLPLIFSPTTPCQLRYLAIHAKKIWYPHSTQVDSRCIFRTMIRNVEVGWPVSFSATLCPRFTPRNRLQLSGKFEGINTLARACTRKRGWQHGSCALYR